jgi:hypothetical protein
VGSVAEEAARLLDALGGWAASSGYAAGAPSRGSAEGPGRPPAGDTRDGTSATSGPTPGGEGHCEHCGAENGAGRAVVCRLCPVCQGIGLLRSVRPETVDRLADLAGALADTLRELADHRRAGQASAGAAPAGTTPADAGTRHTRSRVQDIAVEDETTATS